jgi:hypothetical protein
MRPKARLMPGFFLLGAIWQKRGHRKNGGSLFVQGRRYFERPGERCLERRPGGFATRP